ncbi:MAG: hypothetical protein U1F68_08980 [Gammaproteobacteria bacterium]
MEHVLGMLAAGDAPETLLEGYLKREKQDIQACLAMRGAGRPRAHRAPDR